jgi:predicted ATPase
MITQIEIGNVRVFDGTDWQFPLSKISVFCGTNSAGKSTIFKCLLLLMQTQSATDTEPWSGRLRLSGPIVDLGSYRSFVSHKDVSKDIVLGVGTAGIVESRLLTELRSQRSRAGVHSEERKPSEAYSDGQESSPEAPYPEILTAYTLKSTFTFGVVDDKGGDEVLKSSPAPQAFLKHATFDLRTQDEPVLNWQISLDEAVEPEQRASSAYCMKIPRDYFEASGDFALMDVPREGADSQATVRVKVRLRGLFPEALLAKSRTARHSNEPQWSSFPVPSLIRAVFLDLERELMDIHYLGPLRSPAKRFYLANLDGTPRMDAVGDFLPYILRDHGDLSVTYLAPPPSKELVSRPLKHALSEWIHYVRTGKPWNAASKESGKEIDFTTMRDVLLEFSLQSFGGETHALADSGFGYSQLLPIVVRGLFAKEGNTIAIEQPEVHLNPALQVRLAEFLASLALAGKYVLIETHSEHIVNSLRVIAAEDSTGVLAAICRIFFLDTDLEVPQVRNLEVQKDGSVPEWPRAFMGEALSLSSRLLRAQRPIHDKPMPSE